MKQRMLSVFVALALFLAVVPSLAAVSAPRLDAPRSVARGDAFLAAAVSSAPMMRVVFHWNGKRHPVEAREKDGSWRAEILLAVPLEIREAFRILEASVPGGGSARAEVAFFDRNRPVQKLNVDRKYVSPPKDVQERIRRDREKVSRALAAYTPERRWNLPLLRPVSGGVSSLFGLKRVFNGRPRGMHKGLDLRSPQGAPIAACADGTVALADDLYYSGNAVYLDHGLGVFTAYLHMSKILVAPGETVRRGQTVGLVGATGRVTGPHLHLSLFAQGVSADIQPLLEQEARPQQGDDDGRAKR